MSISRHVRGASWVPSPSHLTWMISTARPPPRPAGVSLSALASFQTILKQQLMRDPVKTLSTYSSAYTSPKVSYSIGFPIFFQDKKMFQVPTQ